MPNLLRKSSFALVCLLFLSLASAQASDAGSGNKAQTLLVYGDSLSAAYNIKREEGWVSLLQDFVNKENLNVNIVNASISGETTDGGLARYAAQLKQTKPSLVILELGGNDGLRGFDLQTTHQNLSTMINMSHQIGAKVILAGIELPPNMGRTYTRKFREIYQDLGKLDNVTLIPFILEGVATHDDLMQRDGIHPNAKGQPIIMKLVWQYFKPLVKTS